MESEEEVIACLVQDTSPLSAGVETAHGCHRQSLTRHGLIPRPDTNGSKGKMQMLKALGLEKQDLELMKKTVLALAEKRLNMDVLVSQQSDAWKAYLKEAALLYPQLNKYTGYWPLARYTSQLINNRIRKRNLRERCSEGLSMTESGENIDVEENENETLTSSRTTAEARNRAVMDFVTVPVPPQQTAKLFLQDGPGPIHECVDSDACPDVTSFLRGLSPDLSHLWPLFKTTGIDSGEALNVVRDWPAAAREDLLNGMERRGELSRFESMVILLALEK